MSSKDAELGTKVHQHLTKLGLESPINFAKREMLADAGQAHMLEAFTTILSSMGLDLTDDSLELTPGRLTKMYRNEIFYGLDYSNFPKCSVFKNKAKVDEMVAVVNIDVRSVCEHHFVPFIGRCAVAYIPGEYIVGLSKLNRIVDFFCRRPQVQERLTEQVASTLQLLLQTEDIAVVMHAEHYCVKLRGVSDPHSSTVTSKMLGRFRENPALRNEFLQLTRSKD